ncbi:MAG: SIR2 family NAD-dependent protein deacylase [Candidatus Syntropharchaeia archaeon]
MEDLIKKVAREIVDAERIVALTGAGISVESGIAPFRGKGGLWEKYDPEEYAHIVTFRKNPERSWIMLKEMLDVILAAKPNPAHKSLARLEEIGKLRCIITQNVDSLHQEAGSKDVIEFHGNNRWLVCMECRKKYRADKPVEEIPPRCECGGVLKPDAVFFGEPIPVDALYRSQEESEKCDVMLVIGTSGVVQPAASMPSIAKRSGARIVEINPEPTMITPIADYFLQGSAAKILPRIVEEVETLLGEKHGS